MHIILIRRCVKENSEREFLKNYKEQKPTANPDFLKETLTKVRNSNDLPMSMRNMPINCENCVTYINIAWWKSAEAFIKQFNPQIDYDPKIECEPKVRIVLDEVEI